MKNIITSIITLCLVFSIKAQEAPTLETYSLKNGLKIYFIKYGKIEAMNFSLIINSGKKNETPGQQGYNNLTANLVLQGNKKYSEDDQNDKAFAIGSSLSAGSGYDYTTIESNFLAKDANVAVDLISAAVLQPLFDKEKVNQYISYMVDYNNPTKMDISNIASVFSNLNVYGINNPLGRSIYKKQLQLITPEKLIEFYKFNYTPKNTKIIVCGNFNSTEMKNLIETYFGAWQSSYGEVNSVSLEPPSIKKQEISFVNRIGATQCALLWTKNAPTIKDKDILAFKIANALFNQALFKEIREIGGKTYSIGSSHITSQFSNLMSIGCSVRSNEALNTINLFDKTLQNFSLANFTQQEFDNEITRYRVSLLSMENPAEVADFYNPLLYDFEARKNTINELAKLKMEDIQKVIKKYYTPGIYKLVICGDESVVQDQLSKIKNLKKNGPSDIEYKEPAAKD
jgi:predicted Zn-dependent peptidase